MEEEQKVLEIEMKEISDVDQDIPLVKNDNLKEGIDISKLLKEYYCKDSVLRCVLILFMVLIMVFINLHRRLILRTYVTWDF